MKMILLMLVMLILSGCAVKKLAVRNADHFLTYQVSRKVPLNPKQKEHLEQDVKNLLKSSKPVAEEIIPIINTLSFDANKLDAPYAKLEAIYMRLAKESSSIIAKYISELDDKQAKSFFEIMERDNEKIKKKEKDRALHDIADRMRSLLGEVNKDQVTLMNEYESYFHGRNEERFKRRLKLHEELKVIFKEQKSLEGKEKAIKEAFYRYQEEAVKGNKNLEMLKKLLPTITLRQQKHFMHHMDNLKELLQYYLTIKY